MRDTHARSSRNSWLSRRIAQLHLARQLVEAQNAPQFQLAGLTIRSTTAQNGAGFYEPQGTSNTRTRFGNPFSGTPFISWSGTRWELKISGVLKLYGTGDVPTPDLCAQWFTAADAPGPICTAYYQPPIPPEP